MAERNFKPMLLINVNNPSLELLKLAEMRKENPFFTTNFLHYAKEVYGHLDFKIFEKHPGGFKPLDIPIRGYSGATHYLKYYQKKEGFILFFRKQISFEEKLTVENWKVA